jgi:hypothetical protein
VKLLLIPRAKRLIDLIASDFFGLAMTRKLADWLTLNLATSHRDANYSLFKDHNEMMTMMIRVNVEHGIAGGRILISIFCYPRMCSLFIILKMREQKKEDEGFKD